MKLTLAELPLVMAIEEKAHTHPWTTAQMEDAFLNQEVYGKYQGKTLVGFVCISDNLDWLEILDIAVAVPRQGVGTVLLDRVKALATDRQRPRILLEVRTSNHAARALYQNAGFKEIHRRKGYYPVTTGEREDALIMEYI